MHERPSVAGRYRLLRRIAQGGMGEVYVAEELASERRVALKRLLQAARKRRALFRAEYHTLARLRHPNIIEVYDYGLDGDLPYYTMELLDGEDLREHGPVGVREACRYLRDIAGSLALLHAQRLIHRDVSPRNVRITAGGRCKLFDFGTMVPFGIPSTVGGTPPFASPEAWDGARLDQRADIYSLGALAYWLLSRRLPGPTRHIEQGAGPRELPPDLASVAPDVPRELSALIMAMLALEPSKRPRSATEVITHLNALAQLTSGDSHELAHSFLDSSRIVARKRELVRVERRLRRGVDGSGAAFCVTGFAGVGKSRFLEEVALDGQTRGYCVVRGHGVHGSAHAGLAFELYQGFRRVSPSVYDQLPEAERAALDQFGSSQAPGARGMAEVRADLQAALTAYVAIAAKLVPWLVVVDDLDCADEFSAAFVGALARSSPALPLVVIASFAQAPRESQLCAYGAYAQGAVQVRLEDLTQEQTHALVSEMFGPVPNRRRLSDWLFRSAHGNPGATMELSAWLLRRGTIRYLNGAFVLPDGDIMDAVPQGVSAPGALRLTALSEAGREVAKLLAHCRGGATLELCVAASGQDVDAVLLALDDLVEQGVLSSMGPSYVFRNDDLRAAVCAATSEPEVADLHRRLAAALARSPQPSAQLEAGFHLLHTPDALHGAVLLTEVAPELINAGVACRAATEALEKALEVFEARGGSLERRLFIRTLLVLASFLYDYRLAFRYGVDTVRALHAYTGFDRLRRWERVLGGSLTLLLSVGLMWLKRLRATDKERGPSPKDALSWLGRATSALIGVRATALDGNRARELLRYIGPFKRAPFLSAPRAVYLSASAMSCQPRGGEAALDRALTRALGAVNRSRLRGMPPHEHGNLRTALMLLRGMNECFRYGKSALTQADELEAQGTHLSRLAALRVRFAYHVVRGMRDRAEVYRQELDVLGIQAGTTWQVEWFAVPVEGMASSLLGDAVGAGQAHERLLRLVHEVPSLEPFRDMVRLGYEVARGDDVTARELGRAFVSRYAPYSLIGWAVGYAVYAGVLNRMGAHAEARELCERALSALHPGDDAFEVMYGPLSQEIAVAAMASGDHAYANSMSDGYVERMEAAGEYALVAHVYEVRAVMARKLRLNRDLARWLVAMREAAERSESASLVDRAERVVQANLRATMEFERAGALEAPPEVASEDSELLPSEVATPARGMARVPRSQLLTQLVERTGLKAISVVILADNDGMPQLLEFAGEEAVRGGAAELATHIAEAGGAHAEEPFLPFLSLTLGHLTCELVSLSRPGSQFAVMALLWKPERAEKLALPSGQLARYAAVLRADLSRDASSRDAS